MESMEVKNCSINSNTKQSCGIRSYGRFSNYTTFKSLDETFKKTKVKLFGCQKLCKMESKEFPADIQNKYPKLLIEPLLEQKVKMHTINYKERVKLLLGKSENHEKQLENILSLKGITVHFPDIEENGKNENNHTKNYPKRSVKRKYYKEDDLSSEDELLYCDDCGQDFKGACPKHGPMLLICDKKVPKNTPDRAIQTLPNILSIGKSSMPKAGLGVWTEVYLPKGVVFGPYKGSILKDRKEAQKSGYAWKVWDGNKAHHYVEAVEKDVSNWLRFVNCADREERQNLLAFQFEKKIYYKIYKPILPYSELLVWYGDEYGEDLGFIPKSRNKSESSEGDSANTHKCYICYRMFSTLEAMEKHQKIHSPVKALILTCPNCNYSTNSKTCLDNHMITHSSKSKSFSTRRSMKSPILSNTNSHSKIHTSQNFSCHKCNKSFLREFELRQHELTHKQEKSSCSLQRREILQKAPSPTKDLTLSCLNCNFSTNSNICLNNHMISHSDKKTPLVRQYCANASILNKMNSLSKQHISQNFSCNKCNKTFEREFDLEQHGLTHIQEKSFSLLEPLKKSGRIPSPVKDLTLTRLNCNSSNSSKVCLDNLMRTHSKKKISLNGSPSQKLPISNKWNSHSKIYTSQKFSCNKCNKTFRSELNFKQHELTHRRENSFNPLEPLEKSRKLSSPVKVLSFTCSMCNYSTNSKICLNSHIKTHSDNEISLASEPPIKSTFLNNLYSPSKSCKSQNFPCSECNQVFDVKFKLKQHGKTHRKVKSYICSTCSKCFTQQANLSYHQKTHSNEKIMRCPHCDDTFFRHHHLEKHITYKHKQAFPYTCPICNKGFMLQQLLSDHADSQHKPELLSMINNLWEDIRSK